MVAAPVGLNTRPELAGAMGAPARPMARTVTEARCRSDGEDFCFKSVMRCLRRIVRCGVLRAILGAGGACSVLADGMMLVSVEESW